MTFKVTNHQKDYVILSTSPSDVYAVALVVVRMNVYLNFKFHPFERYDWVSELKYIT